MEGSPEPSAWKPSAFPAPDAHCGCSRGASCCCFDHLRPYAAGTCVDIRLHTLGRALRRCEEPEANPAGGRCSMECVVPSVSRWPCAPVNPSSSRSRPQPPDYSGAGHTTRESASQAHHLAPQRSLPAQVSVSALSAHTRLRALCPAPQGPSCLLHLLQ